MINYLKKGISTPIAIGIILVLAVLVGGFTIWQYLAIQKEDFGEMELNAPEQNKLEDGNDVITIIINEIVPEAMPKDGIQYAVDDLDNDGIEEVIIYWPIFFSSAEPAQAYLNVRVVNILNGDGNYEDKGNFYYEKQWYLPYRPPLFRDVNKDGIKEIVFNFGPLANLSYTEFGILRWEDEQIDWLKYSGEDGIVYPMKIIFGAAGRDKKSFFVGFGDIYNDKIGDFIEIEDLKITAYEWNGEIFSYNEKLTENLVNKYSETNMEELKNSLDNPNRWLNE